MAEITVTSVAEMATHRGNNRAAAYRERAQHLRSLGETEPVVRVRDKLLDLADQYEALAANLAP